MDADGGDMAYAQIEQYFNDMGLEGPSAQVRMEFIYKLIVSFLPPPLVPAPEVDNGSDSDEDSFSLNSSSSSDAGIDLPTLPTAAPGDGVDHISRLPDSLLSDIISRLPTKEAGRTVVLSKSWRGVWAATPLVVDDALLGDEGNDIPIIRAVWRCVDAHPGPVRSARLTRVSFDLQEYALRRLVAALAVKEVKDLILFNRPWPLDMPLPDDILHRCGSLERLYLGVWRVPKITAAHPPALHMLRELGLFHCIVSNEDLDALLTHCPKLEVLSLVMSYSPSRLRVVSRSLKVVVEWMSSLDEVVIEDAPCLQRLLLNTTTSRWPLKIVRATRLEVLGFLDLDMHTLEIGGIAIEAGMEVRARAMLPSLKILAVKVQFARNEEAKMMPTLLKCFPCLETLHIMPVSSISPDDAHDPEFWESLGSCECLESHLKMVFFHGFLMQNHEIGFQNYIFREGKVLEVMVIPRTEEMRENFNSPFRGQRDAAVGGGENYSHTDFFFCPWTFQNATNLDLSDPFCVLLAKA